MSEQAVNKRVQTNTVIAVIAIVLLAALAMYGIFRLLVLAFYPPTSRFEPDKIIGFSEQEVVAIYGEPYQRVQDDRQGITILEYEISSQEYSFNILDEIFDLKDETSRFCCEIVFDDTGTACRIYQTKHVRESSGG